MFVRQIIRKKYLHLFLFFIILFADFFYNFLNLNELSLVDVSKVRSGITIVTNDDLTYLRPAINLIDSFELKDGSNGIQKYFLRSPGYTFVLSFFYFLFGLKNGLLLLVIFQTFLHAISFVLLLDLSMRLNIFRDWILFSIYSIIGLLPFTGNFLFYTLTEGLTPFLVILYFYSLFFKLSSNNSLIISGFSFSFLMLTRPVFFFLILPLIYKIYSYRDLFFDKIKFLILYVIIIFSPLLLWQIRNTIIAGEYPGIYPIYYKTANNIYRPSHNSIWNFAKSWGVRGDDFHNAIGEIWGDQIKSNKLTSDKNLNSFFSLIPKSVFKIVKKEELKYAFQIYKRSIINQKKYFDKDLSIPEKGIVCEDKTVMLFNDFKSRYQKSFPLSYFIKSPFIYLKQIVFHSNISLYIFQHTFRGDFIVECMRYFCFIIHTSIFFCIPITIFFSRNKILILTNVSIAMYVFFLAFYYRELEERYTLPIILPLIFSLIYTSKIIIRKWFIHN